MKLVSAIVVAAGEGLRFKSKASKPLVILNSKPIIIHSLAAFSRLPQVKEIIVVANRRNYPAIIRNIRKFRIKKISRIVYGGLRRQDSVYNGLKAVNPALDLILIHDAARPFADRKLISAVIKQAGLHGAAISAVRVKPTIKESAESSPVVRRTLKRNLLWEAQTPQVFERSLLLKAYKKFNRTDFTDDAGLVERLGKQVRIVEGSYKNIKITTPEDLTIAKGLA
jgi:2-C-methyl-D-erythritol 4-phosphate cytidylyltransferase